MENTETQVEETTVETRQPQQVIRKVKTEVSPIPAEHPVKVFKSKKAIFRTYQIVWYLLGVVEALLLFRLALKAFGANAGSGFADLIYTLSAPFALPFIGIFGPTVSDTAIIEWSTILAAIVYLILAFGIVQFLQLVKPVSKEEVEQEVDSS